MIYQGNDPRFQPSFSVTNRFARAIWGVAYFLLFRPTPVPLHEWRALLLRLFGAKVGRAARVYPGVRVWAPWQLEIGDRVLIGNGVTLYNMAPMKIGARCVISQGAHLCGGTHDIDSPNFQLVARAIELEPEVWICAEAFVGPGVRVAEGCVIGARAVLTKSAPVPWTVWKGNPAIPGRCRSRTQQAIRTP